MWKSEGKVEVIGDLPAFTGLSTSLELDEAYVTTARINLNTSCVNARVIHKAESRQLAG